MKTRLGLSFIAILAAGALAADNASPDLREYVCTNRFFAVPESFDASHVEKCRLLVKANPKLPHYIETALRKQPAAWRCFEALAPSHRRQYVGWIETAKREETKQRRLKEAIRLLAVGKVLGLK